MSKILQHVPTGLWLLLALLTLPFVWHAGTRPFLALQGVAEARDRLFHADDLLATLAVFAHMIPGAVITFVVPLQVIPAVRRHAPRLHRASGRVLAAAAALTAVFGLVYIARQGTVGGPWMSFWFGLYGVLMLVAAALTVHHARARRFDRHRRWALRLLILAIASYLYRVHYGINFMTFGGVGVDDFNGWFDRAMVWAFYLPYLVALELWFLVERAAARRATVTKTLPELRES